MNIKKLLVDFVTVFAVTLIVSAMALRLEAEREIRHLFLHRATMLPDPRRTLALPCLLSPRRPVGRGEHLPVGRV
jgi:hypothetical protein